MLILISQISILGLTAFQDFRERAISWIILPILLGLGILHAIENTLQLADIIGSFCFVSLQILFVYLFFVFKNKTSKIDFRNQYLGIGDILFFFVIIPFFEFYEYILILTSGLIFSLVAHFIYNLFYKTKTIPLAGWLSIFLIYIFCLNY